MVSRFFQSRGRSAAVHDGIDERLELIAELARALAGPLDTEELGVAFLRRLRRVIPSQGTAAVMLTQPEGEMVLTIAADGPLSAEISQSAFSLSALPLELRTAFDERKPIVLLDTLITSDVVGVDAWTDLCSHVQTLRTARFVVLLPLVWRETPVGVVFIRDDAARAADARRVQLLSAMADHLASALYSAVATGDEAGWTQRMALIERLVERVGSAPSAEKSIKSVLDDLGRMLGASAALAWNQADGEDLQLLAAWSAAGVRVGEQLRGSASPVEKLAVLNGETVAFDAIANEARLEGFDRALLSEIGVVSSLAVPLHFPRRRVGALVFHQVGQART